MTTPSKIFISYASEDRATVRGIYQRLKALGYRPWMDTEDLLPGQDWSAEIKKALHASDFIVLFLSSASVSKQGYVQREYKLALDVLQEIPEGQIFVIPAKLDECTVPDNMGSLQWVNLYEEGGFAKMLRSIQLHSAGPEIDLLEQSSSQEVVESLQAEIEQLKELGMTFQQLGLSEVFANRDAYFDSYSFKNIVDNAPAGSTIWFFSVTALNLSYRGPIAEQAIEKGLHLKIAVLNEELVPVLDVSIDDLNSSIGRWRKIIQDIRESDAKIGSIEIRAYSQLCFDQCCIFEDGNVPKLAYVWRFGQGQYDKPVFLFSGSSKDSLYHKLKKRFTTIYNSGHTLLGHPGDK